MRDARLSTALPSHPKTKKLARRLGPAGPLCCIYLFLWAAANRSDGDLSGMTDEDIELAVDWTGDDGEFVRAMSQVGFLDGESHSYVIHDWAEHNPWAAGASDRSEASRWAALCKRYGRDGAADRMPEYATRMRPARDPDAPRTNPHCDPDAPSPSPSPIQESSMSSAAPSDALSARIAEVTADAISAFNDSIITKAKGGNLPNVSPKVGREKRQGQVKRCLRVARQICEASNGSQKVTPEFWEAYFDLVAQDDFYSGRKSGGVGHENYVPDFELLTRESTMLKIYDKLVGA